MIAHLQGLLVQRYLSYTVFTKNITNMPVTVETRAPRTPCSIHGDEKVDDYASILQEAHVC